MKTPQHQRYQPRKPTESEWDILEETLRLNRAYIPHAPTQQQAWFLALSEAEIMYGGAAGGGKTNALLMAALQYVHVPSYSAIVFRRSYTDLELPDALIPRSKDWLTGKAKWRGDKYEWEFPSGATLTFGYISSENDKYRYQGAQFQFIGFDELTHFSETQYRYLFSRLRRLEESYVPLRMRGASNPGGIGHCVPYGEVLTPTGWRDITEIQKNEPVFTLDDEGFLKETLVEQKHEYDYSGEMIYINTRGFHMAFTPEHKIVKVGGTKQNQNTHHSLVTFDELPGQAYVLRTVDWVGKHVNNFTPPEIKTRRRKHNQPKTLDIENFVSLLGWFLSEGSVVDRDKAFSITQQVEVEKVESLLQACGFTYSYSGHQFTVYAPDWWNYFRQFGKARDKYIPTWVKNLNKQTLRVLFEALVDGDGRTTNDYKSGHYYTISKQLADDVSEIALKLGYIVSISDRQRKNRKGLSYAVAFKSIARGATEILTGNHLYDVDTATKRTSDITKESYSGKTYCLGIPETHTFIIKQKGSVWVSGNSWVKQRFITEGAKEGRLFIPASLWDNPYLDREEYVQSLMNLDPTTRAQLLNGDWTAREAGSVFRREWFSYVSSIPSGLTGCRYWDLAATAPKAGSDPDYTCGVLLGIKDGIYYVADVVRFRGTPADVEKKIRQTAIVDRERPEFRNIEIRIEEEKGQAGISLASHYSRNILRGFNFRSHKITGDKEVRANPVSASAQMGNVALFNGAWLTDFLDELESFPNGSHNDQVDGLSGSHEVLSSIPNKPISISFGRRPS